MAPSSRNQTLVVDASSLVRTFFHTGIDKEYGETVNFNGEDVHINSPGYTHEIFVGEYIRTMQQLGFVPQDTILVLDGSGGKKFRKDKYPFYKSKPSKPVPEQEFMAYFAALKMVADQIRTLGGVVAEGKNMEADDMVAYICKRLPGNKVVWCKDRDFLSLFNENTDIFVFNSGMNVRIHEQCPNGKAVLVYKALVGDPSDTIPGCPGFGKAAFVELVNAFGEDCLEEVATHIEQGTLNDLAQYIEMCKPIKKIVENIPLIEASYWCARFHDEEIGTCKYPIELTAALSSPVPPHKAIVEAFGERDYERDFFHIETHLNSAVKVGL
jgi:5'-3' exonuclease